MAIFIAHRSIFYGTSYANRLVLGVYNNRKSAEKKVLEDRKWCASERGRECEKILGVSISHDIMEFEVQE